MFQVNSCPRRGRPALVLAIALALMFAPGQDRGAMAESLSTTLDVPYRTVDGITLYVDIFAPDSPGPFPSLLLVHGGGWRYGNRTAFDDLAADFAASGFVAFSVDYRLAPPGGNWHAVAPVEDLKAAMQWVRAHAAEYGGDPTHVGAVGGSAGGNLVQMLATTGIAGTDRPDATVSLSGASDLPAMDKADPGTYDKVRNYIGCSYKRCPTAWVAASPRYQVTSAAAPSLVANSTDEKIPVDQATSLADALQAAGVPVRLELVEGGHHSQQLLPFIWDHILRFLRTYLE
jgi:acetyl esterase/lipase